MKRVTQIFLVLLLVSGFLFLFSAKSAHAQQFALQTWVENGHVMATTNNVSQAMHVLSGLCFGDACDATLASSEQCDLHEQMLDRKGVWNNLGFKYGQTSIWNGIDCFTFWTAFQNISSNTVYETCIQVYQTNYDAETEGNCSGIPHGVAPNQYVITAESGGTLNQCEKFYGHTVTTDDQVNYYTTNTNTFSYYC
jgi:hypothetical protein